jgi:two-component system, NarL family, nitrate/nitrite response regulator NarL
VADDDTITVVVADDHVPTRALVAESLTAQGFDVVAQVGTAPDAVTAAVERQPQVCLVDLNMPGRGLVAVREITQRVPDTNVVVFTVSRADADLFTALQAGAVGYLVKDVDPDHLGAALRGVLQGEAAIPSSLVTKLITEFRSRGPSRVLPEIGGRRVRLTEKEWAVLEGLREGLATKDIAERLGVSQVTVRTHVAHILHKLEVPDRQSALRLLDEQ